MAASAIKKISVSISDHSPTLKTLRDKHKEAKKLYKAAIGATTKRRTELETVRATLQSYKQSVEESETLHTEAKAQINKLQGKITVVAFAIKKINVSISDHSPTLKTLWDKHEEAKKLYKAAVRATTKMQTELKAATKVALLV